MKAVGALREGDLVDFVAPGFRFERDELRAAVQLVESWGLRARVPRDILGRDLLCSQSDDVRLRHLRSALCARDSKVIWGIRGGYGSIRLLPGLSKVKRPAQAKLFIGLSDLTSLHLFLNQEWKWMSWHGPHANYIGRQVMPARYTEEFRTLLFGEKDGLIFGKLKPLNRAAQGAKRRITGVMSGGNMISLQSSLGTPWPWQTKGKIILLEEIGERAYRIDRMLTQFGQAGLWREAKAVVLGDFVGGREPDGRNLVAATLKRWAQALAIPVFKGVPSGHDVLQRVVPFGTPAVLDLKMRNLRIESGLQKL